MFQRLFATDQAKVGGAPDGVVVRDVARRGAYPTIALAVIVTCQLMLVLDATIVNIALPNIQQSLHFSDTGLSWVINAYTLAFGSLLLLGGRAGDILGRRKLFMVGISIFSLASLIGGFATSAEWLMASRAVQGVGAAIAAPSALSLIATTFAEGPARTRALAIFSSVSAAGASLGLIAGGMLTSWVSWRWVLFVNVPIGVVIVLLAPVFIQETQRRTGHFDITGAITSTVGMVSLVYGFIHAGSNGWGDDVTLVSFGAAFILLSLFLILEMRKTQPILPLKLFANRNRSSAYLSMLLFPATMYGVFFFLTQFVQEVLGFSPVKAGFAFLPISGTIFAVTRVVTRLIPRFGPKPLLVTGATLLMSGILWLTSISASTEYVSGLLGPMVLLGLGVGLSIPTLSVVILSGVQREDSGAASGLLQTMQQVGATLGIVILVTRFGTASRNATQDVLAGASPEVQAHHVMAHAMGSTFMAGTIFAALALIVALFGVSSGALKQPARAETKRRIRAIGGHPSQSEAPVTVLMRRARDESEVIRIQRVG
ncbi:MAG: MFS transporter [Thermomicrobiales bacterium]